MELILAEADLKLGLSRWIVMSAVLHAHRVKHAQRKRIKLSCLAEIYVDANRYVAGWRCLDCITSFLLPCDGVAQKLLIIWCVRAVTRPEVIARTKPV